MITAVNNCTGYSDRSPMFCPSHQCWIQWVQHRISRLSRLPLPQLNSTVRRSTRSISGSSSDISVSKIVGGQRWHHSKERRWFPVYRLSIVTVALAICNRSAAICDRMSPTLKSTGGGSFWAQILGCSPWSRPPDVWVCRERTSHSN